MIEGLLDVTPAAKPTLLGNLSRSRRRFVVIDENVMRHYGGKITALLARYGVEHQDPLIVPGGEHSKTWFQVERIVAAMDEFGVARFDEVIGFGGGVLHDLLGVAAGVYRRGIDFRFFGTTLVAAIDAMFALKCGLNIGWKNRIGLYHPAVYSATDNTAFFGTLGRVDVLEGFAEMMKWAIAGDERLFRRLEAHGPRLCDERFAGRDTTTREAIARTIGGMMPELYSNPYEHNPARRSYIGHGLSPGIEPDVPHGQAVTLEILAVTMIARRRGLIGERDQDRIVSSYRASGLKLWHPAMEERGRLTRALASIRR